MNRIHTYTCRLIHTRIYIHNTHMYVETVLSQTYIYIYIYDTHMNIY